MPVSNSYGRSFEYILCNVIQQKWVSHINFTPRAEYEQQKDISLYNELPLDMKESYRASANKIYDWLLPRLQTLFGSNIILLDRLPDLAGVQGDVTDIRFSANQSVVNISLKHNHNALKHPRLTRVPNWINASSQNTQIYKNTYDDIWKRIIIDAERHVPGIKLFNELNNISKDYINQNIYHPLCELVRIFLTTAITGSSQVNDMFKFLVGNNDFIKIIDYPNEIIVSDFAGIPAPTSVEITHPQDSYLKMKFDNGWILSLRLHTASSRLHTKSIKFDVRAEETTVSEERILK